MEQKKKIKITIITLAVLLALSLTALCGTLVFSGMVVFNKVSEDIEPAASVSDNVISPDKNANNKNSISGGNDLSLSEKSSSQSKNSVSVSLYNKQSQKVEPFNVGNMLPGDTYTKDFLVRVSYHDKITVHYSADVRPGYEKLAEVLKIKIKLPSDGEIIYDGLMKDMPKSIDYKLSSDKSTTDDLNYEISAYLDTSVGNEYQNKDLIADFKWWVDEPANLDDAPKTGVWSNVLPYILIAAASGCMLIVMLLMRRRREGEENG